MDCETTGFWLGCSWLGRRTSALGRSRRQWCTDHPIWSCSLQCLPPGNDHCLNYYFYQNNSMTTTFYGKPVGSEIGDAVSSGAYLAQQGLFDWSRLFLVGGLHFGGVWERGSRWSRGPPGWRSSSGSWFRLVEEHRCCGRITIDGGRAACLTLCLSPNAWT